MAFIDVFGGLADLVGTGINAIQDERDFQYQKGIDERNFNYEKALQQQIFNREDTAYQRAVADAQAAGLSKGVVSGGAGSGAVLGTSSSGASHNMDWSKLGSLASNWQQRKMNALSMKQANKQNDISDLQLKLLKMDWYDKWASLASNPAYVSESNGSIYYDIDRLQALRDAQFESLMSQFKNETAQNNWYATHPWLKDVVSMADTIAPFATPFINVKAKKMR